MMSSSKLVTILAAILLQFASSFAQDKVFEYKEPVIVDVLNQTLPGQCLVPSICLDKGQSCGVSADHHVTVNCSFRQAGPYVPSFQPYILPRRTWDIDFSNNGISTLDSFSFFAPTWVMGKNGQVAVNLTRVDLSNNYINSIAPNTFREEVSAVLSEIDLSYNSLEQLKDGVFNDVPALQTLILHHNKLLNMDSLCMTAFSALTVLNLERNFIASFSNDCLAKSKKVVSAKLNYNYIGSIDDCSISPKMDLHVRHNPMLCGCSTRLALMHCILYSDKTNTTTIQELSSCSTSQCDEVSYSISYKWVDGYAGIYNIVVELGPVERTVQILQYSNYGKETEDVINSVSIKLVQQVSKASGTFTSGNLNTKQDLSVCVTPSTDSEYRQRKCTYLRSPYYITSDVGRPLAIISVLSLAVVSTLFY